MNKKQTRTGIEILLNEKIGLIRGLRIGLVCNQASVLPDLSHAADVFKARGEFTLTTLFGPQHGIRGDLQDNMIETPHTLDAVTRIPIFSLYSETREPTAEMLENLDAIVIDLQDVGCRIYTFAYTMANCMRAAKKFGKKVFVCDRPNPVNGRDIAGTVTKPAFASFVGQFPIATRHGLTMGEMAKLFNEDFGIGCDLEIVTMQGWERDFWFTDTNLPWVLPSPNMPTPDTAVVFPGTVHFEGTEISEGRGTTKPFELIGAPFIDPEVLCAKMREYSFAGVHFRPTYFQPTFQKFAKTTCGGTQLHVSDRNAFEPVIASIALLKTIYDLYTGEFQWKQTAYEYEFGKNPFDVVCGTDALRKAIENGETIEAIEESWKEDLREFRQIRENCLLY